MRTYLVRLGMAIAMAAAPLTLLAPAAHAMAGCQVGMISGAARMGCAVDG